MQRSATLLLALVLVLFVLGDSASAFGRRHWGGDRTGTAGNAAYLVGQRVARGSDLTGWSGWYGAWGPRYLGPGVTTGHRVW